MEESLGVQLVDIFIPYNVDVGIKIDVSPWIDSTIAEAEQVEKTKISQHSFL